MHTQAIQHKARLTGWQRGVRRILAQYRVAPPQDKKSKPGDNEANAGTVTGLIEHALKLSLLFGILGYLLVQFHLAYLGLPSIDWSNAETSIVNLLVIFYPHALGAGLPFARITFWTISIASPLLAISCILSGRVQRQALCGKINRVLDWLTGRIGLPILTVIYVFALVVTIIIVNEEFNTSVVVGPLHASMLKLERPNIFYFDLALIVIGYLIYLRTRRVVGSPDDTIALIASRLTRTLFILTVISIAIWAILLYSIRPAFFHLVKVQMTDKAVAPRYGLLISDDESIQIWRVRNGAGRIDSISKSQIAQLVIGPRFEIRKLALEVGSRQGYFPSADFFKKIMAPPPPAGSEGKQ